MSHFRLAFLSAGICSLAAAWPASAQFYGGTNNYAPGTSQAYSRGLAGSADQGGNLRSFSVGGNGGFFGGGGGSSAATPWSNKYGGFITKPNSGLLQDSIARQQAYFQGSMQNQDLELRRLQLKQATFDEMMYEKMNTPPPELVREEQRLSRLTRARNTPPENEIASGAALNELMTNIQRIEAREGVRGYAIPIDPETLKYLNVSTSTSDSGSNEFFKTEQLPEWPDAFATNDYAADRKRVEDDIVAMVKSQRSGVIDRVKAIDARKTADSLKSRLYESRFNISFTDYANALSFLTKLNDTIATLGKPGAKNFVDGTYAAKGNTVSELLDYMTSKGLHFAKASTGYEPYYYGFYQQLVTYDIGLGRLVGDQTTMMYQPTPPKK